MSFLLLPELRARPPGVGCRDWPLLARSRLGVPGGSWGFLGALASQHPAINAGRGVSPERGQTHNAMGPLLTLADVPLVSAPRVSDAYASHDT
jgi:hypothetical protein